MLTAPLLITAKKQKQPKCPSADEGVNKKWSIHMVKYYSAKTKHEVLIRDTTWMNLENAMLS